MEWRASTRSAVPNKPRGYLMVQWVYMSACSLVMPQKVIRKGAQIHAGMGPVVALPLELRKRRYRFNSNLLAEILYIVGSFIL